MIRRVNLNHCLTSIRHHAVRISPRRVRSASQNRRLGEKLHTKSRRRREDPVHPNPWRRGRAFVSSEHALEQIRLHCLHANPCPLRRKVERGAGGGSGREGSMAPSVGIDCTIDPITARIVYWSAAGGGLTVCYQCSVFVFISPAIRISVAASA